MLSYLLCYQPELLLLIYMLDLIIRPLQLYLLNSSSGLVHYHQPDKGQEFKL